MGDTRIWIVPPKKIVLQYAEQHLGVEVNAYIKAAIPLFPLLLVFPKRWEYKLGSQVGFLCCLDKALEVVAC